MESLKTAKIKKLLASKKIWVSVVSILIIVLAISVLFNQLGESELISDEIEGVVAAKSIAVLPFTDMSPDQDQEYLGDGIAEEIINRLTNVSDLKVIGRTSSFSFKEKDTDLKTIGEMLGVESILEGSVQKSGNHLRITAQLINAKDGFQIWSERFEREFNDIFSIQDELAQFVVSMIKSEIAESDEKSVTKNEKIDPEAYDYFLKGKYLNLSRFYYSKKLDDFENSEKMFFKAIEINPNYSLAYAGLADLYNTRFFVFEDEVDIARCILKVSIDDG